MRSTLIIRIWIGRLFRYLVVPTAFCIILFPLYGLLHQQMEKAQLADAAEQMSTSVNIFERHLSDLRFTTNKLFNDSSYMLLSASSDNALMGDYMTPYRASTLLQDLTYSLSYAAYGYVTFARNHLVVDEYRVFKSYERFYPSALEYTDIPLEEWAAWLDVRKTTYLSGRPVVLNRTAYPDSYVTISQPFISSSGQFRGACTVLLREKYLSDLFLPMEKWRQEGLFYLVQDEGTLLTQYQYAGDKQISSPNETSVAWYQGQKYLFVSRHMPSIGASAVIGLPYSVYGENLQGINRAIWFYVGAGLLGCLLLSAVMTLSDLRALRPTLEMLDGSEIASSRLFNDLLVQKLRKHNQLTAELARTRGELEYGRIEALLKTGAVGSAQEQQHICAQMHLTQSNYLLLIPAQQSATPALLQDAAAVPMGKELWLMMIAQRVHACYGHAHFIYNTTDGHVIVILALEQDDEAAQVRMCRQTEALHTCLELSEPVILSGCFTTLAQLSDVYWQARNMATYSDRTQQVCYLNGESLVRVATTDITSLERLNEYLLSGRGAEAQALIEQLFPADDISPQNFQQAFYSVRGVLLGAAQAVECESIAALCTYDDGLPAQRQVQNLQDCCFEICNHVDSLKRSHNEALQRRILAWLDEQYPEPNLNVAMVAAQFHIFKKYVSQFLKDQTGKSYTEYVEELRLSHAMEMLKNTQRSITEVSEQCGFSTQNTFYKAFRRRFGLSPSSVRQQHNAL